MKWRLSGCASEEARSASNDFLISVLTGLGRIAAARRVLSIADWISDDDISDRSTFQAEFVK